MTEDKTVEYTDLRNETALALALASERVTSARAQLELREIQMQNILNSITLEYQENGKYRIVELNMDNRKIGRVKNEE